MNTNQISTFILYIIHSIVNIHKYMIVTFTFMIHKYVNLKF